jgi:inosine-uridine nucleoside N-ribohydrolase
VGVRTHAPDIHGKSGLDGAELPEPDRAPAAGHAIDFIIAEAERRKGTLVLAGIGPLTNLALALRREPKLASWLKAITIMGGSATLGNVTPAAEFNVWCDPEAAAVVLDAGLPVWMVGYNLTRQIGFEQGDIDRLRGSGRRVAATVADLLQFYLDRQRRVFGLEIAPMHDVCAIVPFVAPGLIEHRPTAVRVELRGEHTRGMTVCDLRNKRLAGTGGIRDAAPPNVRLATAAEARPLIDRVLATLLDYP